jgi:hypothetical protein
MRLLIAAFDVSETILGSVTLDSATNVPGIDASRVTFDAELCFTRKHPS